MNRPPWYKEVTVAAALDRYNRLDVELFGNHPFLRGRSMSDESSASATRTIEVNDGETMRLVPAGVEANEDYEIALVTLNDGEFSFDTQYNETDGIEGDGDDLPPADEL